MSIQEHLNKIRNAIKGSEVRESIAKGIETAYNDASEKDNANMEVKLARGTSPNLNTRLNKMDETDRQNTEKIDSNYNEVTAQLAQTDIQVQTLANEKADNKRIDEIITTPAEGISEQEIIDARQGEASLGANISKVSNALDFTLTNEIENGDFSNGLTGWHISGHYEASVVDNGLDVTFASTAANPTLRLLEGEFTKGHVYYFYVHVEGADDNIQFQITSGGQETFGVPSELNSFRGSGVWSTVLPAQKDNENDGITLYTRRDDTSIMSSFRLNRLFAIDLTKTFGVGNEPSVNEVNKLLSSTGLFNGEKVVSQKDMITYFELDLVTELLQQSNNEVVKVKYGPNLINPEVAETGEINGSVGEVLYLSERGRGFESQRIEIVSGQDIVFRGVRIYSFVDKYGYILSDTSWVDVTHTHHIEYSDIPENATHIWVTYYEDGLNNPQLEFASELSPYEPYGIEGLYVGNQKILDFPIEVEGGGEASDPQLIYETRQAFLESKRKEEEREYLLENAQTAMKLKPEKEPTIVNVPLTKTSKQKLILHLHKRENEGYDTKNDVYLPNAENDFSDIKITDDNGNVLPYRTTFKTDSFDVIADERLGLSSPSYAYLDSQSRLIGSFNREVSVSVDGGKSWDTLVNHNDIINPHVTLVDDEDSVYFSKAGVLYKSEYPYNSYSEILDTRDNYTGTHILASSMVQHPDGELFVGAYQKERIIKIYRSVDRGNTWEQVFNQPEKYQHVHAMYIDEYQTPVAVYAGLDGGGGVLKTIDKGQTWVDLREENPDMPQSTDFGVVYSDPSGYRLLGGETAIVGGHTLLKTIDDINFRPVLSTGSGIYNVRKLDGKLFTGGVGTNGYQSAKIYMSEDEGETWQEVYTTSPLNDTAGASDGFRYVSVGHYAGTPEEQIIVSSQSASRSPLRILPNGAYAEIIIDVPEGTASISVEDGFHYPNEQPIINDVDLEGELLVHFPFNEGDSVIKENVSGKLFQSKDFEWGIGGKQLSSIYPPITDPRENNVLHVKSLKGFEVDSFDTSQGLTISFWGKNANSRHLELIKTSSGKALKILRHQLHYGNEYLFPYVFPLVSDTFDKIDIVMSPDGTAKTYTNGKIRNTHESNQHVLSLLSDIQSSPYITLLNIIGFEDNEFIQHFSIRRGEVSERHLYEEYNSYLTDNIEP